MKKLILCLLLLFAFTSSAFAENISFSGTVVSSETVEVYADSTATVESIGVKAGQYVDAGDTLAILATTKVYSPLNGVVTALFAEPGDNAADAAAAWGSVMLLDEAAAFTVSADIEKAYSSLETQTIIPGETVYLRSRSAEERKGMGIVTAIDNTAYTVKGTQGNFVPGESVNVFRTSDFADASCLGRGTIARLAPTAVTAEGTIALVAVNAGSTVKKGDLLMETVSGSAASPILTAPIAGIIAQINLTQGSSATEGEAAFVFYPESTMQIECTVPEGDLRYIAVGDTVSVTFLWDDNRHYVGNVDSISAVPQDGTTNYTAIIAFEPDSDIRYGMTAMIEPIEQ